MKNLNTYILEKYNTDSIEEYLESIVNSTKSKPKIYDDTESWEADGDFDYWQSTMGEYDDTIEFIDKYAKDRCVAGWCTEESFEETEKMIPKLMKDIMKKNKPEIPYKKNYNQFEVWKTKKDNFDINVLKFKAYKNRSGEDYVEFWYMIAIEN